MSFLYVHGADCQLGYGFDEKYGYILPFKCEPLKLTTIKMNHWISMENHNIYKQIWSQNYLNTLENRLNIDENEEEYHNICILKFNGYEECESCDKYPENFPSFIHHRSYGFSANIIVKKHNLPFVNYEAGNFLVDVIQSKSQLSPEQERLTCYVVINGKENHTWTLKELVEFCREHGDNERYQGTLSILLKHPKSSVRIQNKYRLMDFFEYLYLCYRKVEATFAKRNGFLQYEFEQNSNNVLHEMDMINNLRCAMNDYQKTKDCDLTIRYFSMKKLFHVYRNYLEYCILHGINFKVTYDVVEDIEELRLLWKKLISSTIIVEENEQLEEILEAVRSKTLQNFLKTLQLCIEKTEIKIDKVGYLKLKDDELKTTDSVKWISIELQKSIEKYQKMSRTSFLNMYPTMKKLYLSYLKYIKLYVKYNIPIDEDIPGEIEELNSWSKKLDLWKLEKVDGKWYGSDETVLFIREDNVDSNPISKKMKNKEIRVISDKNLQYDVKFLIKHPEIRGAAGLFQPKTCPLAKNYNKSNVYVSKCPSEECPDFQRKWVCTDCYGLLRIRNVFCECQDYDLNELDFICPSKKHPELTEDEHDEGSVSDVSSKDEKIKELTMKLKEAELKNIQNQQFLENFVQRFDQIQHSVPFKHR